MLPLATPGSGGSAAGVSVSVSISQRLPHSNFPPVCQPMNKRLIVPCAGLVAGAVAGWFARPSPPSPSPAPSIAARIPDLTAGPPLSAAGAGPAASAKRLSELQALWTETDGEFSVYENLAGVPAATLLAWLNELMPPEIHKRSLEQQRCDELRNALVERLAEQDPAALAGWVMRVPGAYLVTDWLETCVQALLERNPPDAARLLARLDRLGHQTAGMKLAFQAETDPEGAYQQFLKNPAAGVPEAMARWLMADPARTAAFCDEHPKQSWSILLKMSGRSQAELKDFAALLTNPEAQHQLRRHQLTAAAREGDADSFALLLEQSRYQTEGNHDAFAMLARSHPDKAEALLQKFAGRPPVVQTILDDLAASHPERAAAILATPGGAGPAMDPRRFNTGLQVLRSWSVTDPAAALTWLEKLPAGQKASLIPRAGGFLANLPAADWLTLTRGLPVDHDGAVPLAQQALEHQQDPAALAEWCASFPDNSRQHLMLRLREQMKNPIAAADLTRRVEAALSPPP